MKSAMLISPGLLEISTKTPIPEPGPGEVVIKVRTALTCGTDLKAYKRGHPKIPMPSPLGHEFSGDVHAVGEGVDGFAPGMPVMGVHTAPCGTCGNCIRGRQNLCDSTMEHKVLGAYAEYLKLPAPIVSQNLYHKPEQLSYAEAAMLEPLACVVHGLDLVKHYTYNNVLVLGAGPIGLLHLMMHKSMGRRVVVAGRNPERLELAGRLGADSVVDSKIDDVAWKVIEATDGAGADLVIEATGSTEVWEAAAMLVRKGGIVMLFGGCPQGATACFDTARVHYDEIMLMGAFHFTPADVRVAYDALVQKDIIVTPLISGDYPLSELETAFRRLDAGHGIKYAIIP